MLRLVAACLMLASLTTAQGSNDTAADAQAFLEYYNKEAQIVFARSSEIHWTYATNITTEHAEASVRKKSSYDLCNIEPEDMGGILILRKMRKDEKILC